MCTTHYNPTFDELETAYFRAARNEMPPRWRNALNAGYELLLISDGIQVEHGPGGRIAHAHIPSQSDPDTVYIVNGECTCKAAEHGNPCAHRAAKRLLQICYEQAQQRAEMAQAQAEIDELFSR